MTEEYISKKALCNASFMMSNDYSEYSREVYGVLDYIGDVGGLVDGITYIVQALIYLFSLFGY